MGAERDRRAWVGCVAAIAAASALAGASVPATAAVDRGPLTCLDGYVWRQATPRDHVCVTPAARAQTARDNALASSRRSTTPGTFGPDLCAPGYLWREALPGDRVCVTPATWQQVHDDNLTAGSRRNALRVKIARDAATGTYRVHADGINVGVARVAVFAPGRTTPARSWAVVAHRSAHGPGGELSFDTRLPACATHPDAILRVRDPSSLRWSSSRRIATGCTRP
jgi:uncharacterized protein (DUF2237 family)